MKGESKVAETRPQRRDPPERTFAFALRVLGLCRDLDRQPGASSTFAGQLVRSGTSVGASAAA